jgi:hypothetical protein
MTMVPMLARGTIRIMVPAILEMAILMMRAANDNPIAV